MDLAGADFFFAFGPFGPGLQPEVAKKFNFFASELNSSTVLKLLVKLSIRLMRCDVQICAQYKESTIDIPQRSAEHTNGEPVEHDRS